MLPVQGHLVPQVAPPELKLLFLLGFTQQQIELVGQIEKPLALFSRQEGRP